MDSPVHQVSAVPPSRAGEEFGGAAVRLAGLAGLLLGWRPGEFWGATPGELMAVLGGGGDQPQAGVSADDMARLRTMFPD